MDTIKVFASQYQIYLKSVHYEMADNDVVGPVLVECSDNIVADIDGDLVNVEITRTIDAKAFTLSVTMGAELRYRASCKQRPTKEEIEEGIGSSFIASNIFSRLSLMISQISASYGQQPLVTPPGFVDDIEGEE